ncbi:hypothetical protein HNP46_005241 [Pseudomonas nitritireducens]|uniref:Uncharacterized protein n=1 Tax=Pseudomonas nitroreducens TaxID=46680 RepID=A0A7W7KP86_PSENT|nr:hypothetical protein [Pseudomonas nitritireducens]MBB4866336.1 hypothetical protein [Pseudomonas nitritireducens]
MQVQLIPVIELFHLVDSVPVPPVGPYWEQVESWREFHERSLQAQGFGPRLRPYLPGSAFHRLGELSDADIARLIRLHCEAGLKAAADWQAVGPLPGGYVLRVGSLDVLFPQCCSDLGDLQSWKRIAAGKGAYLYSGHPSPDINQHNQSVSFDFNGPGETFVPPPPLHSVTVPLSDLTRAVHAADRELRVFAARLELVNAEQALNVPDIATLLLGH